MLSQEKSLPRWVTPVAITASLLIAMAAAVSSWRRTAQTMQLNKPDGVHIQK